MTCKEFDALKDNNRFARSTTAERAAAVQHYVNCPRCRANAKVEIDRIKDLQAVLIDQRVLNTVNQKLEKDCHDPEWREQMSKLRLGWTSLN